MPMTFNQAYCIAKIEMLFDECAEAAAHGDVGFTNLKAARNSLALLSTVLEQNPQMFAAMEEALYG